MKKHIFEDIILQNALNFTKEVVDIFDDLLNKGMDITEETCQEFCVWEK
ncbi:hypothetical protein [Caldanaerobacter subterraneus]